MRVVEDDRAVLEMSESEGVTIGRARLDTAELVASARELQLAMQVGVGGPVAEASYRFG